MLKLAYSALLLAALAGCAATAQRNISPGMTEPEVSEALGKPAASGRLATGEEYRDYSQQPFGYRIDRITFGADGRVRDVRNLLTEANFKSLRPGMTPDDVLATVGPSPVSEQRSYAGGTQSWSYRYRDVEVIKLLHVIFGPDGRVQHFYTEWDPRVYSKGDSGKDGSGGH